MNSFFRNLFFLTFITLICVISFCNSRYNNLLNKYNELKEVVSINNSSNNITIKRDIVNPNYIFLGDSIFDFYDLKKYFPNLPVVNSGIAGNITDDILNDLEKRVYVYNPSKVILLIGINDLLYEDHDDVIVDNIEKIVSEIKSKFPHCEIYIQSIYPMNEDWRVYVPSEEIIDINTQLEKYCSDNNFSYLDFYSLLIDEDSKFDRRYTNDGLHPNEEGYRVITDYLNEKVFNKK